jgi:hypothetical protein
MQGVRDCDFCQCFKYLAHIPFLFILQPRLLGQEAFLCPLTQGFPDILKRHLFKRTEWGLQTSALQVYSRVTLWQ